MGEQTLVALIGVAISILLARFSAQATAKQSIQSLKEELQKEFASRFNEKRWEGYSEFSAWMNTFMDTVKTGKADKTTIDAMGNELRRFVQRSWLFGSKGLIHAFSDFYSYSRQGPEYVKRKTLIRKLFQIVVEMRKDLGDEQGSISADDLARTIYPDWDSLNENA